MGSRVVSERAAAAASAAAGPPPATDPAAARARSAIELVGLVIAPTSLLTALAFYFGYVLTNARASYFGIDASALGFSTQDYLLRSTDALFVPLGVVIVLALGAVRLHAAAAAALADPDRVRLVRRAATIVTVLGGCLFAVGAIAVFRALPFSPHYLFAPSSPGIGIALLAYGLHLRRRCRGAAPAPSRGLALTLVAMLVVLSGFWTASTYAAALGRGRAVTLAAQLERRPHVTVFAPKRLDIAAAGVEVRRLPGGEAAARYRISGLRLLIRSNGKYFLLPTGWTRARGSAIVLDDRPEYRFEFSAGG